MKYYYLLTSLPELTFQLGDCPFSLVKFWHMIKWEQEPLPTVAKAVLLIKDIANLECLSYQTTPTYFGSLDLQALTEILHRKKCQKHLPFSVPSNLFPKIWDCYFQYACGLAKKESSVFLSWLYWEQKLRENIEQKANKNPVYKEIIEVYKVAETPWHKEQVLDLARLNYLQSLTPEYSFSIEEVIAYALKLLILARWWQITHTSIDIFTKVCHD